VKKLLVGIKRKVGFDFEKGDEIARGVSMDYFCVGSEPRHPLSSYQKLLVGPGRLCGVFLTRSPSCGKELLFLTFS